MTDRILIDSTEPAVIAAAVKAGRQFHGLPISMAGYYVDGKFAATPAQIAVLAGELGVHSLVAITVFGTTAHAARIIDSEPGDATPAQAAAWAHTEHAAGHWPVIYCDRAGKPHVIAQCQALGLHPSTDYGLWVATLDGSLTDLDGKPLRSQPGVVAIQFMGAAAAGINVDVSLVVSAAWRAPKPPPPPPVAEVFGYLVTEGSVGNAHALTGRAVTSHDGGKTWA